MSYDKIAIQNQTDFAKYLGTLDLEDQKEVCEHYCNVSWIDERVTDYAGKPKMGPTTMEKLADALRDIQVNARNGGTKPFKELIDYLLSLALDVDKLNSYISASGFKIVPKKWELKQID